MNQEQSNVSRILIVVGVLALVAIVAYFTLVQRKLNEVAADRTQLQSLKDQYESLHAVAVQKPLYLALISQVQSRLKGVELTADPRAYIPSYLKQIEDLAKRDGLVVTAIVPGATPTPAATATPAGGVATIAPAIANAVGLHGVSQAAGARNAANAQAAAENTQMPQAGPSAAPMVGATPVPGATGAAAGANVPKTGATTSPRINAQVYLSQSFEQVPINMEMAGSYTDLEKFLRDLNKFPKLIGVGNITVTPIRGAVGETPQLHIVLPIIAYRLSPGGPAPAATPPPSNGG